MTLGNNLMKDVIFHNGVPCHVWLQYYHIKGVLCGSRPKPIVFCCSGCDPEMLPFFGLQLPLQMSAIGLKMEGSAQCSGCSPALHLSTSRWTQSASHFGSQKLAAGFYFFPCHRRSSSQEAATWGTDLGLPGRLPQKSLRSRRFSLVSSGGASTSQSACPSPLWHRMVAP